MILMALIALGHACGFQLNDPQNGTGGDDVPRDEQVLVVQHENLGSFAGCQAYAEDLAQRVAAEFSVQVTAIEGRLARDSDQYCDATLTYEGPRKLETTTFGDDDWNSDWLSLWQYETAVECEAGREEQKTIFAREMKALVLSDRCYEGSRRQIPFQAYEIKAIVPKPVPAKVLAWNFSTDLAQVWAKVEEQLASHEAVIFRDKNEGGTRFLLAYVAADAAVPRIERAGFNWYDGAFVNEADCQTTVTRIDQSLKARFAGMALDSNCVTSDNGFQPQMHYISERAHLGLMGTNTGRWFESMAACDAEVSAADAATPKYLHFCVQEVLGARRFVLGYFAMP